jgi:MFS family permease
MFMRTSAAEYELTHPASPAHVRRNATLGVLNGIIGNIAQDFLHAEIILAGLVLILTKSWFMAALVPMIQKFGALGPQMLIGRYVEHLPRKRPYFVSMIVLRTVGHIVMVLSLWWVATGGGMQALLLFLGSYFFACVSAGAGHVVSLDMIGRMIPTGRIGIFLGLQSFLGSAAAVVVGLCVIQPILYWNALTEPYRYLILVIAGSVLMIGAMCMFSLCREEDGPTARSQTTWGESLRRGWRWLRENRDYRLYLWQRVAFRVNCLSLVFFVPYGQDRLRTLCNLTDLAILGGLFVATLKASRIVGGIFWGHLADRRGYRACFIGAGVFFALAPALAMLAPQLPIVFDIRVPFLSTPLNLPLLVYLLALVTIGMAHQAQIIAGNHFRVTTAPPHRRVSYAGFANTITVPLTLLPLAGATLKKSASAEVLFSLLVAGGLFALVMALPMSKTRPGAQHPAIPANSENQL